jgi:hypothetical protein
MAASMSMLRPAAALAPTAINAAMSWRDSNSLRVRPRTLISNKGFLLVPGPGVDNDEVRST